MLWGMNSSTLPLWSNPSLTKDGSDSWDEFAHGRHVSSFRQYRFLRRDKLIVPKHVYQIETALSLLHTYSRSATSHNFASERVELAKIFEHTIRTAHNTCVCPTSVPIPVGVCVTYLRLSDVEASSSIEAAIRRMNELKESRLER